jgi:DNA gyrase/topoisomerase IV subunit B
VKEVGDTDEHGTEVRFLPDASIFTETEYRYDTVAGRLRDLSYLNKGIRITLTDLREKLDNGEFRGEEFYSTGGLRDFVQYLDGEQRPSLAFRAHLRGKREGRHAGRSGPAVQYLVPGKRLFLRQQHQHH